MSKGLNIEDKINNKLFHREKENCLRLLTNSSSLIDFCSNDYLGFSNNLPLKESKNHGATGSRLITGNSLQFELLEASIAKFHKAPAGLIFNSGYDANLGLFSCIAEKGDTIIYDQYIHASIRDGVRLSHARSFSFQHNNIDDLEKKLQQASGSIIVAVESVYSMDGDIAPLKEIIRICKKYDANIILDEAHATGVIGNKGEGLAQHLNVETELLARIHTFSKALGCHGAIVLGSSALRTYLINFARSFIYTTALSEHHLNTIESAYKKLEKSTDIIKKLHCNISFFKSLISKKKIANLIESSSPIQSILIPKNENVKNAANKLINKGINVKPILYPTVEKGKERIRICIHSFNTEEQIKMCVINLEKLYK